MDRSVQFLLRDYARRTGEDKALGGSPLRWRAARRRASRSCCTNGAPDARPRSVQVADCARQWRTSSESSGSARAEPSNGPKRQMESRMSAEHFFSAFGCAVVAIACGSTDGGAPQGSGGSVDTGGASATNTGGAVSATGGADNGGSNDTGGASATNTGGTGGAGTGETGGGGSMACSDEPSHTGQATYYTTADGSGNCSFDPSPNDLMIGAMNATDYQASAACGGCVHLTGPNGAITIRIVDQCPECPQGNIDLSPTAFDGIAARSAGRVPITWNYVACSPTGSIQYEFKDGSKRVLDRRADPQLDVPHREVRGREGRQVRRGGARDVQLLRRRERHGRGAVYVSRDGCLRRDGDGYGDRFEPWESRHWKVPVLAVSLRRRGRTGISQSRARSRR